VFRGGRPFGPTVPTDVVRPAAQPLRRRHEARRTQEDNVRILTPEEQADKTRAALAPYKEAEELESSYRSRL
jgi:hypothetical protein